MDEDRIMNIPLNGFGRRTVRFVCLLFVSILPAGTAGACDVPVARYALLYWPPDYYEGFVFHKGKLGKTEENLMKRLMPEKIDKENPPANVWAETVDISKEMDETVQAVWNAAGKPSNLPFMAVCYPHYEYPRYAQFPRIVWSGSFTEKNVSLLMYSPVRRRIGERIPGGDKTTWTPLETGDREKDNTAHTTLKKHLDVLEKEWEFPAVASEPLPGMPRPKNPLPLNMQFSIIRLSRSEPDETVLVNTLLGSEKDLKKETGKPMAFPVFGKGRMLEALVGEGINEENIVGMSSFLVGPCSCQVKGMNPGIDLLIAVDWTGMLVGDEETEGDDDAEDTSLSSYLPGAADVQEVPEAEEQPDADDDAPGTEPAETLLEPAEGDPGPEDTPLRKTYLVPAMAAAVALLVLAVVAGTVVVLKRNKGEE